jgi:hypothetical protein
MHHQYASHPLLPFYVSPYSQVALTSYHSLSFYIIFSLAKKNNRNRERERERAEAAAAAAES